MNQKVIIFSAPSGSGKSTVVSHLVSMFPQLEFSVSATSRRPRGTEKNGKEYYFISPEEFRRLIGMDAFIEYEEVYSGSFYGTLRSEIDRIWGKGHTILFDIDVRGGVNLKHIFGDKALAVFVKAPSLRELRRRLENRATDSQADIEKRLSKAEEESAYEKYFDITLVNDRLEDTLREAEKIVGDFLGK